MIKVLSASTALLAAINATTAGVGAPNAQAGSYTLQLSDAGKSVEINSSSAQVVTVPPHTSVGWVIGNVIEIVRTGTGSVTITPGAGVIIPNRIDATGTVSRLIVNQFSSVSLRLSSTDGWVLLGDIS